MVIVAMAVGVLILLAPSIGSAQGFGFNFDPSAGGATSRSQRPLGRSPVVRGVDTDWKDKLQRYGRSPVGTEPSTKSDSSDRDTASPRGRDRCLRPEPC